jgi:hypothetical protein
MLAERRASWRLGRVKLAVQLGTRGDLDRFITHMLARNIRIEEDLVDHFFMNKFRKLGFIEYNGGLKVNSSLLSVVLHE